VRWHSESWDTARTRLTQWHRWYAWFPVRVGEQRVWLEWIERKLYPVYEGWVGEYRFPE
jgi:hypothetical protein